jgi:hypothetical protein
MPLDNQVSYRLDERHARFLLTIGAPLSNWNDVAKTISEAHAGEFAVAVQMME